MSDRMTNVEIESVLSSIRRLVSDDARPGLRTGAAAAIAPPANKLVLTPDFRILPDSAPTKPEPARAATPLPGPAKPAADMPVAAKPVAGRPVADRPAPANDAPRPVAAELSAETGRVPHATPEFATRRKPEADWDDAAAVLKGRIAVLEAAVAERAEDWDPDGSEDDPMSFLTSRGATPGAAGLEMAAAAEADRDVISEVLEPIVAAKVEAAVADALAQHPVDVIAEAEAELPAAAPAEANAPLLGEGKPASVHEEGAATAPGIVDTTWQQDPAALREQDPLDWQDDHLTSSPRPVHLDPEAEGASVFAESGEEAILDEETLRELVRDIIRQELQGTLGERITRNVRKLVRAEISRALASRDFD